MLNTLSSEMIQVVRRLENDWDFIASFLNNPEAAINKFNLSPEERDAIITRNVDKLMSLGIDEAKAVMAASGAHSQTCAC